MNVIILVLEYICLIYILTPSLKNGGYAVSSSPPPPEPQEECPSSYYLCEDDDEDEVCDSSLRPMTFDVGNGEETTMVYVTPDVSSFYREDNGSKRVLEKPFFEGFGIKVINLSPEPVSWWWHAGEGEEPMFMDNIDAFEADGTSSFGGHEFYFTPADDPNIVLKWFDIVEGQYLYYYDAFVPDEDENDEEEVEADMDIDELEDEELELYNIQKRNLKFAEKYRNFTGREWMSLYPREDPRFKMWRADYFGQKHWVVTKETHFVDMPTDEELTYNEQVSSSLNDTQPRLLHQYRSKEQQQFMNMTMEVLSCAPRVFKIDNFLSEVEVQHVLDLGTKLELSRSTTGDGSEHSVRTSKNTWVEREQSVIVDSIYRRAADLLLIDEALLRKRDINEFPDWPSSHTVAESLQLVHYNIGEKYTPHHDAGTPSIHEPYQADRFATLLLYLNENMTGGETSFPRWMNAETGEALKVTPKIGQAILFYNYLPDGNFDELAQHSAEPVIDGEKWITNLWVWEPYFV